MRQLTFKSFLSNYLRTLSSQDTSAPFRLAKEIDVQPRLLAPLCLYAMLKLDGHQLERFCRQYPKINAEFLEHTFLQKSPETLPAELERLSDMDPYRKCWNSYISVRDQKLHELHTKQLMAVKISALQQQYGISNYRVYTSLKLNPGNINAYLTHADASKVSLNTARRMLDYVRSCGNEQV